mgnify:CR=1 FL=1
MKLFLRLFNVHDGVEPVHQSVGARLPIFHTVKGPHQQNRKTIERRPYQNKIRRIEL